MIAGHTLIEALGKATLLGNSGGYMVCGITKTTRRGEVSKQARSRQSQQGKLKRRGI